MKVSEGIITRRDRRYERGGGGQVRGVAERIASKGKMAREENTRVLGIIADWLPLLEANGREPILSAR